MTSRFLFIEHLREMLSDPRNAKIIAWTKDGDAFEVHNVAELEKKVLRRHFNHGKFSSFARQLCNYSFFTKSKHRNPSFVAGVGPYRFQHAQDLFHRDHPERICKIERRDSPHRNERRRQQRPTGQVGNNKPRRTKRTRPTYSDDDDSTGDESLFASSESAECGAIDTDKQHDKQRGEQQADVGQCVAENLKKRRVLPPPPRDAVVQAQQRIESQQQHEAMSVATYLESPSCSLASFLQSSGSSLASCYASLKSSLDGGVGSLNGGVGAVAPPPFAPSLLASSKCLPQVPQPTIAAAAVEGGAECGADTQWQEQVLLSSLLTTHDVNVLVDEWLQTVDQKWL